MPSRNNALYLIIGALIVVVAGMGYYIYDQQQNDHSVELKIGNGGVSISKD